MAKKGKAAVCRQWNQPVSVEEVETASPKRGEVMVRIAACGVCHSDLSATNGTIPLPPPLVIGHEAAGVVEEVGEGVADVAPGDHVAIVWIPMCGRCRYCTEGRPALCDMGARAAATLPDGTTRYSDASGKPLHHMAGVGVMAQYATVHRDNVLKIDPEIPLDKAALVGCAVMTGVGAALNTAQVRAGTSVVVFGAGGIGLNVIQGAALAGAYPIIAVDLEDKKLGFAQQFGATHTINPGSDGDPVAKTLQITEGGADYSFECIGNVKTMRQALECCHKGWGVSVIIGVAGAGQEIATRPFQLVTGRVWKGTAFGGARGRSDVPQIVDWYMDGKINIDDLITHTLKLDDINKGFDLMHEGKSIRSVVVY